MGWYYPHGARHGARCQEALGWRAGKGRRGVRGWIRAQTAPLPPDLHPQTELASMRLQVCDEDRASLYVEAGDAARYEMKETNEGTGTRSRK